MFVVMQMPTGSGVTDGSWPNAPPLAEGFRRYAAPASGARLLPRLAHNHSSGPADQQMNVRIPAAGRAGLREREEDGTLLARDLPPMVAQPPPIPARRDLLHASPPPLSPH